MSELPSGDRCQWCGNQHGAKCVLVRSVDFYRSGEVKKISFWRVQDLALPAPAPSATVHNLKGNGQ